MTSTAAREELPHTVEQLTSETDSEAVKPWSSQQNKPWVIYLWPRVLNISGPMYSFSCIFKSSLSACIHSHCSLHRLFQTAAHFSSLLWLQKIKISVSAACIIGNTIVTILVDTTLVFHQERSETQIIKLIKLSKNSAIQNLNWK